ncbi:unnamed protein product, partial [marine sediment metagenome]
AQTKGHLEIVIHNIRDYSIDKHNKVDDYQYGGGAGMVMSIEPIAALIEKLIAEREYDEIIFMTPDGELLEQRACNEMSLQKNMIILCGHYKGVDERIREQDSVKTFDKARISTTLLVNNAIHPGEPDGINACLIWIDNWIGNGKDCKDLPVIGIIPAYNVGGMMNRSSTSRANQDGPEEYGFRGN